MYMYLSTAIKALTLLTGSGAAMAAAAADGDWPRKDPEPSEGVRALPPVKRHLTRSKAAEAAAPAAATAASAAANASPETGLLRLSSSGKGPAASSLVARQTRRLCGHGSDQGGPGCLSRRVLREVQWQQLGDDIDGEAAGDNSGDSVAISSDGRVVAVRAPGNDGNGDNSGHVRIWEWNESDSMWQKKGDDIDGEAAGDGWGGYSGNSVALSSDGNVVAIGAPHNGGNGYDSGHVRVWEWNESDSKWEQRGLDINGGAKYDQLGESVALSSDGSVVAVGAPYNQCITGHVRVYEWNKSDSKWEQRGENINGEAAPDKSGHSVALSSDGSVVAIGAPFNSNGIDSYSGHVRVYEWNKSDSKWQKRGLDMDGRGSLDWSGYSVALSSDGSVVAVGAPGYYPGYVRVWEWNESDSTWDKKGDDIDGEAGGYSGESVALSSDGSVIAIGAPSFNGGPSGQVRIWEWDESASKWQRRGADIDGEAANDESGYSVALSSDGSVVAVGAPHNDGNGDNSGHVRVFKLVSPTHFEEVGPVGPGRCLDANGNHYNTHGLLEYGPTRSLATFEDCVENCPSDNLLGVENWDWKERDSYFRCVCFYGDGDLPSRPVEGEWYSYHEVTGNIGKVAGSEGNSNPAYEDVSITCYKRLNEEGGYFGNAYKLLEPDSKPKCDASQAIESIEECQYAATSGSIGDYVLHDDGRVVSGGDWHHTPCGCFLDATKKIWFDVGTTCTQVHDEYSGYSLVCRDPENNLE